MSDDTQQTIRAVPSPSAGNVPPEHHMHLLGRYYRHVEAGRKTTEVRVAAPNKRDIGVGDTVVFHDRDTGRELVTADLGFPHTPRMAIKAAHYLTPVTPDCGLTMFLPGSHRLADEPVVPAGAIDPPGAVTPDISVTGTDAVLFENRTWHTGGSSC
ncbi:phytanoyl-CoA dioxygenase family protein [Streptomyces sp. NBC_00059]|uniref:phytanoyl-CoA dioxygenase family protein n=1 Tax=Streptomyces sp. NBC_00059 TaxID=2975635 RepID=UPI0022537614|nr:phytanoyl-CoA dioxygenase family protein [Streptomyces sp. NBC_00059]MCX5418004.1 phytanoyl-CoA dioxygenase family protein [Streptomyces sp. NBC_00059]